MFRVALILTLLAAAPYYRVGCECAGESGWQPGSEWTAGASADAGPAAGGDSDGGFPDAGADAGTVPDAGVSGGDAGTDACGGCPDQYYCENKECLPCCTGIPPLCAC